MVIASFFIWEFNIYHEIMRGFKPKLLFCNTCRFEEFLSSQVTQLDLIYLEDINVARKLVELGYRGTKEGYSEEQFWAKKAAIEARKQIHCVVS